MKCVFGVPRMNIDEIRYKLASLPYTKDIVNDNYLEYILIIDSAAHLVGIGKRWEHNCCSDLYLAN